MSEQSTEVRLALLDAELKSLRSAVSELKDERNHALKWGIVTLGASVISMGVWVTNLFIGGHIK